MCLDNWNKLLQLKGRGGITDNEKHESMTSSDIHLTSNSNHIIVMCAEITVMFRVTHEASSQQKAAVKPEREQPGCPKCAGRFFLLNKCQKWMLDLDHLHI